MFHLAAGRSMPGWSGEVGHATFATLAEAEAQMRKWARFGVDAYCNDPDTLWITDDDGQVLKVWDWRSRQPVLYEAPDDRRDGDASEEGT